MFRNREIPNEVQLAQSTVVAGQHANGARNDASEGEIDETGRRPQGEKLTRNQLLQRLRPQSKVPSSRTRRLGVQKPNREFV